MISELEDLENRLLNDGEITSLDAAQIEDESLRAAKLGSEDVAKRLLAHSHYRKVSEDLDTSYEVNPYTPARKIEVSSELGESRFNGVGPARFGLCLRTLAEEDDLVGFMRLTSAYISFEISLAERREKTKNDCFTLAISNMKYACGLADRYEKRGELFYPSSSETTVARNYFERCHPDSPTIN